jgi:hypothetical protein
MSQHLRPAGYLIVHQDWYELPDEDDPLLRVARISSLSPKSFAPEHGAQLIKHCYEVLEVSESTPVEFTIAECDRIGQSHYETLAEAQDFLLTLGIAEAHIGFNPIS